MASRGKRYKEVAGLLERDARYEPERAIQMAKQTANARFDETLSCTCEPVRIRAMLIRWFEASRSCRTESASL